MSNDSMSDEGMSDDAQQTLAQVNALAMRLIDWICITERAQQGPAIAALLQVARSIAVLSPASHAPALVLLRGACNDIKLAQAAHRQADRAIERARRPTTR